MSVAFYMDEHVPKAITRGLRLRGVDVLRVQDDGFSQTDDELILDRAERLGRIVFTRDEDFLEIATARQISSVPFAGVIYAHQLGPSIRQCIDDLEAAAKASTPEEWLNAVNFLPL